MRLGPIKIGKDTADDPYWDGFINRPLADPANSLAAAIRGAREGQVYPVKSETHSPDIQAKHIKELATFFGADFVGIVRVKPDDHPELPFAIICGLKAEYPTWQAMGVGGQAPVLKGAFVTFNLGAYIREFGFNATRVGDADGERLAAVAGLGSLDRGGRLVSPHAKPYAYVADVIRTDLPLQPDGEE